MKYGDRGSHVANLQLNLIQLGYELPKFGADGGLGGETWRALEQAALDFEVDIGDDGLDEGAELDAVVAEVASRVHSRAMEAGCCVSLLSLSSKNRRGKRDWKKIDSIVLHQTACTLPTQRAWAAVPVHLGVTRSGVIYLINPLDEYVWHGNSFNARSIGIEFEGNFAGLETASPEYAKQDRVRRRTFWKPGGGPHELTKPMIDSGRNAVNFIIRTVRAHGGEISNVFAHRQSNGVKIADPGQAIWVAIGEWAKESRGLADGGHGFKSGKGTPLPDLWTGEECGFPYFPGGNDESFRR